MEHYCTRIMSDDCGRQEFGRSGDTPAPKEIMEDNALRREKAKEKGQEKVDDIKKKRRKRRHEREMQECFTRVLGDASSRMAPNLDKYFGPMLDYMKNNNNDGLVRLEERRITLDIEIFGI